MYLLLRNMEACFSKFFYEGLVAFNRVNETLDRGCPVLLIDD